MNTPLRNARIKSGKTLTEVAGALGISKGALSKIETGQVAPSTSKAEQLARYFGTVSEIEILYPERFTGPEGRAA